MRIVLDTSVLVSAVVYRGQVPRTILEAILDRHVPLLSPELDAEYAVTMKKPKFDRKDPGGVRFAIVEAFTGTAERFLLPSIPRVCDDVTDDHLFALAEAGRADLLISGDLQVLALDGRRRERVLTPRAALDFL